LSLSKVIFTTIYNHSSSLTDVTLQSFYLDLPMTKDLKSVVYLIVLSILFQQVIAKYHILWNQEGRFENLNN
jgi:hypothetical protein